MRFAVKHFLTVPVIAAVTAVFACGPAVAAEAVAQAEPAAPASSLFVSSMDALTVGITPAYSVLGSAQPATTRVGGLGISDAINVSSEFNAKVRGGNFGLFGNVAERPSL